MAGFWAGFGTQFSKDVGEIRKELREDSRSRKNYMDQYGAKTIANAQAKSDEILSMVNQSVAMGVDEQAMLGIFQKSGAKGVRMFHKALLERPNLSIDDYQSISRMGREWVKDTDLDLTEVILRGMTHTSHSDIQSEKVHAPVHIYWPRFPRFKRQIFGVRGSYFATRGLQADRVPRRKNAPRNN